MRLKNVIKIKDTYFVIIGSLKETTNWFGRKSIQGVSNLIYDKWILLVVDYQNNFKNESYQTTDEIVVVDSKIEYENININFRDRDFEQKLKQIK